MTLSAAAAVQLTTAAATSLQRPFGAAVVRSSQSNWIITSAEYMHVHRSTTDAETEAETAGTELPFTRSREAPTFLLFLLLLLLLLFQVCF